MSLLETVLTFGGIPAAVVFLMTGLVYGVSARGGRRYRPGRPYEFTPVWFLSAATPGGGSGAGHKAALPAHDRAALPAAVTEPEARDVKGGASGSW